MGENIGGRNVITLTPMMNFQSGRLGLGIVGKELIAIGIAHQQKGNRLIELHSRIQDGGNSTANFVFIPCSRSPY